MATERSLERIGVDRFDLLLLHNPDRIGYTSPVVWDALRAVRDEGLAGAIGVAPGPANGFTLDLIDCFERFGELIEWAMVILNPLEPWPGELVLPAAREHGVKLITRVVDYGGLFWDDVLPGHEFAPRDHRGFRPAGWVEAGRERLERMRPIAARHGMTMIQLACQWNLAHEPVRCVAPTLIQEPGEGARAVERKRAELADVPARVLLSDEDVAEIRAIGDNTGCMALKGASPQFAGDAAAGPLAARHRARGARRALGDRPGARPGAAGRGVGRPRRLQLRLLLVRLELLLFLLLVVLRRGARRAGVVADLEALDHLVARRARRGGRRRRGAPSHRRRRPPRRCPGRPPARRRRRAAPRSPG